MDPLRLPIIGMILSTVTVAMLLKHLNICVNDVQPTLYHDHDKMFSSLPCWQSYITKPPLSMNKN